MILPVVCFVLGAAASLLAIRYFTHMFQLNAYKPKVQLKWLWHNSPRLWGQILLLVLAVYGWRQPNRIRSPVSPLTGYPKSL